MTMTEERKLTMKKTVAEGVRENVRAQYGKIAQSRGKGCGAGKCCGSNPDGVAKAAGYAEKELKKLPEGANMGLSCGNPTAIASLKRGEVALDLGSGGGFDVFIAGQKVGRRGRSIGVDMTPEMLSKARGYIASYTKKTRLANVEFRLGEIEHLPVADNSVDVVISNCVINLSPDKEQVWREIARVLKPGGRVAVSDLALLRPLPAKVANMVEALVGCVAGAVLVTETERMARKAGLVKIAMAARGDYIAQMENWNDPLYSKIARALPKGRKASEYVTSLSVTAWKPRRKTVSR